MNPEQKNTSKKSKRVLIPIITLFISMILWLTAATLPVYVGNGENADLSYSGIVCFLWGGLCLLFNPIFFVIWSSNVTSLIALVLTFSKKYVASLRLAIIAAACSLGSILIMWLPRGESGGNLPVTMKIGGYLWIISIFTILCGTIIAFKKYSKTSIPADPPQYFKPESSPLSQDVTVIKSDKLPKSSKKMGIIIIFIPLALFVLAIATSIILSIGNYVLPSNITGALTGFATYFIPFMIFWSIALIIPCVSVGIILIVKKK